METKQLAQLPLTTVHINITTEGGVSVHSLIVVEDRDQGVSPFILVGYVNFSDFACLLLICKLWKMWQIEFLNENSV